MKWLKRIMAYVLVMTMVISNVPCTSYAKAKKKPAISHKKVTLQVGKSKTISIKNVSKQKITWKTSNKKVVKITKKSKKSIKIKAMKKGSAKITAKIGKKKYVCKVTVKPKSTTQTKPSSETTSETVKDTKPETPVSSDLRIQFTTPSTIEKITNNNGTTSYALNATQKKTTISGTFVLKNTKVKSAKWTLSDMDGKQKLDGDATITQSGWSASFTPTPGTTLFTIQAVSTNNKTVSEQLRITCESTSVTLRKEAITISPMDTDLTLSQIIEFKENPADSNSRIIVLPSDTPLVEEIKNNHILPGNTIVFPSTDINPMGNTWEYVSSKDNSDGTTEITVKEGSLSNVLAEDGHLKTEGIDMSNPIAFSLFSDGDSFVNQARGVNASGLSDIGMQATTTPSNTSKKFFPNGMQPKISISGTNKDVDFSVDMNGTVLYDSDGDTKNTKDDQIILNASMKLSDMNISSDMNWTNGDVDGLKMTESYTMEVKGGLSMCGSVSLSDFANENNKRFLNKCKIAGIEFSGVDFSDKLLLGVVGFNPVCPVASFQTYTEETLNIASAFRDNLIFVALYLNVSGEVSAKGELLFDYTEYYDSGALIYKTKEAKYIPELGKYSQKKELNKHYSIATYNKRSKSKTNSTNPEVIVTLKGTLDANVHTGVGVLIGVMTLGIVPLDAYAEIYAEGNVTETGIIEWSVNSKKSDLRGDVTLDANLAVKVEGGVEAKIQMGKVSNYFGGITMDHKFVKDATLFEWKLIYPEFDYSGTVKDKPTLNVPTPACIAKVDIKLFNIRKNDLSKIKEEDLKPSMLRSLTPDYKGTSSSDGTFEIKEIGHGIYAVLVERNGYNPYVCIKEFKSNQTNQILYLTPIREENWLDICQPSSYSRGTGYTYIGDGNGQMYLSGINYDVGVEMQSGDQGSKPDCTAEWDLNGQFQSLRVRIGHKDNSLPLNCSLYIYLDGAEEANQIIALDATKASDMYTIELNGANTAKFVLDNTQWDNFAYSCFGLVEGTWEFTDETNHGTIKTKDPFENTKWDGNFTEICSPYDGYGATVLLDGKQKSDMKPSQLAYSADSVTVNDTNYTRGFLLGAQSILYYGKSKPYMIFNTNGEFTSFSFDAACISHYKTNVNMYVTLDGVLDESQTQKLSGSSTKRVTVNLKGAKSFKIEIDNAKDNWATVQYAFINGEWTGSKVIK